MTPIQTTRSRSTRPTEWSTRPAIAGRGEAFFGPENREDAEGVAMIAPPGVWLRTKDEDPPLERDGWRMAYWKPDARGQVLFDQDPPEEYKHLTLAEVVREVAARSPRHLDWVADITERRIRLAIGRMQAHDHAGRDDPAAAGAFDELRALCRESDLAFKDVDSRWRPDRRHGYFTRLKQDGYIAFLHGRKQIRDAERAPGEPAPPTRHSTLRPLFKDDEDDRPRPRPVE